MNSTIRINSAQLLSMLFISRFFTLLVAVPNSRYTLEGSSSLLMPFLSTAAMLILSIPLIFLMKKYPQQSLSGIAGELLPKGKKLVLLWQLLFCILTAVGTASQSEYFVSTALYPNAKRQWVILLFLIVVWYMVCMGLEAISRTSFLICILIVFSFVLIFTGVLKEVDWINLGSPFMESAEKLGMTALAYWGQNMELVLLCILQPNTKESRFKKDFYLFLLGGVLITEIITFFTATVLGSYGQIRMYPVYTLAALSGHGFFSRLDYLHIINWTFACLLRCGMFAYAASVLLQELFPKGRPALQRTGIVGVITAVVVVLSYLDNSYQWFYMMFASGIPVFVTLVLIPLLLLWKDRRKKVNA